jgi:hypothetical protein
VKATLGPAPICIAHSTQHTAAHSVSHTATPQSPRHPVVPGGHSNEYAYTQAHGASCNCRCASRWIPSLPSSPPSPPLPLPVEQHVEANPASSPRLPAGSRPTGGPPPAAAGGAPGCTGTGDGASSSPSLPHTPRIHSPRRQGWKYAEMLVKRSVARMALASPHVIISKHGPASLLQGNRARSKKAGEAAKWRWECG